jgi:hypothetical protein
MTGRNGGELSVEELGRDVVISAARKVAYIYSGQDYE